MKKYFNDGVSKSPGRKTWPGADPCVEIGPIDPLVQFVDFGEVLVEKLAVGDPDFSEG